MGRLENKVAFITGAGSGIARAAAYIFAREGAKVVIAELNPELGKATELAVRDAGGDAFFVETDVTKEDSVKRAIAETVGRYGTLNVLYNCAGGSIAQDASVTNVSMDVWHHTMRVGFVGAVSVFATWDPGTHQGGRRVDRQYVLRRGVGRLLRLARVYVSERRRDLVHQSAGGRVCQTEHSR